MIIADAGPMRPYRCCVCGAYAPLVRDDYSALAQAPPTMGARERSWRWYCPQHGGLRYAEPDGGYRDREGDVDGR